MTTKRKIVLIVLAVVAVALVALAVVLALKGGVVGGSNYATQLSRGDKYLDTGDYDNAVLCFQKAVDLEPEEEDGYLGLARAYIGNQNMTMALNTLDTGYTMTRSIKIYLLREEYFSSEASSGETAEENQTASTISQENGEPALNEELLDTLSKNTYGDYRQADRITSENYEDGVYTVRVDDIGASLLFYNTANDSHVIDPNNNRPYSSRMPNEVVLDSLYVLLEVNSANYTQLSDMKLSALSLEADDDWTWVVSFTYGECEVRIQSDALGNLSASPANEIIPPQNPQAEVAEGDHVLTGRVVSATTGSGVSGAKMEAVSTHGGDTQTVTTENGGYYSFYLDPGTYNITITCSGYIQETFPVTVNQVTTTTANFSISPTLGEGEIRIVLEWGSSPADLDSYLTGTTDSGQSVSTSFMNKVSTASDGTVLAELDVDDTDGYGPETTTLYAVDGVYEFVVVDYRGVGTMSSSGATVKVYVGNSTPVTISVPEGLEYGWSVCRIDHGEVTVLNTKAVTSNGTYK